MDQKLIGQEPTQKEKNKGGRPRAFATVEEMQILIDEYFEIKSGHTRPMMLKNGTLVQVPDPEPVHIEGLCSYLNITNETLNQYQKQDGFSEAIDRAKQICKSYAVDMLFKGKNKADFVMMNCYGWRTKGETENKTDSTTKIIYIDKEEKQSYEDHINAVLEE